MRAQLHARWNVRAHPIARSKDLLADRVYCLSRLLIRAVWLCCTFVCDWKIFGNFCVIAYFFIVVASEASPCRLHSNRNKRWRIYSYSNDFLGVRRKISVFRESSYLKEQFYRVCFSGTVLGKEKDIFSEWVILSAAFSLAHGSLEFCDFASQLFEGPVVRNLEQVGLRISGAFQLFENWNGCVLRIF